jgi:hypothetical protein
MANMSYCRFENTYRDLQDCYRNVNKSLSKDEAYYREKLLRLCEDILSEYDPQLEEDEE